MKKFYYVCPRCGRKWRFYFRQKTMKCPFCNEEWNPYSSRYSKLTTSRFSFTATLFCLAVLLAIAYGGLKVAGYDGVVIERVKVFLDEHGIAPPEKKPIKKADNSYRPWETRDANGVKKEDKNPNAADSAKDSETNVDAKTETREETGSVDDETPDETFFDAEQDGALDDEEQQVVPSSNSDDEW